MQDRLENTEKLNRLYGINLTIEVRPIPVEDNIESGNKPKITDLDELGLLPKMNE
jgi:hypothetical protein